MIYIYQTSDLVSESEQVYRPRSAMVPILDEVHWSYGYSCHAFFLIIPILFALAVWARAGIFL